MEKDLTHDDTDPSPEMSRVAQKKDAAAQLECTRRFQTALNGDRDIRGS